MFKVKKYISTVDCQPIVSHPPDDHFFGASYDMPDEKIFLGPDKHRKSVFSKTSF